MCRIKSYEEIADLCMGIIAEESVVGSDFYKNCLKIAAIINDRACSRLADEEMKNASITNPITGEVIHFDYNKVLECDEQPINYEAIDKFRKDTEKFYEV